MELDCFAGCGTTCAVAEKLGRRGIGIDCSKLAIYTMQKRVQNLRSSGRSKIQTVIFELDGRPSLILTISRPR